MALGLAAVALGVPKTSPPRHFTLQKLVESSTQTREDPGVRAQRAANRVTLAAVDAYVRSCFAREAVPRVSELARNLGVSRGTLTSAVERLRGVTPSKYLRRQKAVRAEELLKQGVAIERVAREAFYGTRRAFFRSFRAETGMTPAAYRTEQNVTGQHPADVEQNVTQQLRRTWPQG